MHFFVALGCSAALQPQAAPPPLLRAGESRVVGSCLIEHRGDSLRLCSSVEPENIQSEWDMASGRAPDYAGVMASLATAALSSRPRGDRRVLMLGLGGGTIAADIMLAEPVDWTLRVTCVEADADTASAAQQFFIPLMFAPDDCTSAAARSGSENMLRRLDVIVADATTCVAQAQAQTDTDTDTDTDTVEVLGGPFDIIVEDFAYLRHGFAGTGAPFWRDLRRALCAPGGTVLINTLYDSRSELEALERDLTAAGWRDVRRRLDRGLQVQVGNRWEGKTRGVGTETKTVPPSEWRRRDNMIFAAVNPPGYS